MMSKQLCLIACLLLIGAIAHAQLLQQDNWYYYNLNGKVKSYTETNTPQPINGTSFKKTKRTVSFTPGGNIAKLETYDDAGNVIAIRDYDYKNKGYSFVIKTKQKTGWVNSTPRVYTYNDRTHTEETRGGNGPDIKGWYNNRGETDSAYLYTASGNLIQKVRHRYAGGHIIATSVYLPNGALAEQYVFQLDSNGRKMKEQKYDGSNKLKTTISHKYDMAGNETQFRETESGTANTGARLYTYHYDGKGNWIYREERNQANKLVNITERKLVYY